MGYRNARLQYKGLSHGHLLSLQIGYCIGSPAYRYDPSCVGNDLAHHNEFTHLAPIRTYPQQVAPIGKLLLEIQDFLMIGKVGQQ